MKSKSQICRDAAKVVGVLTLLLPSAAHAQKPLQSSAAAVLRDLRPLKPGTIETYYFVAKQNDETIGYAVVSLRASRRDGETVYKYKNETSVAMGEKSRATLVSNATLQPDFQPLDIRIGGTAATPAGTRTAPRFELTVDREANEITVLTPPQIMAQGQKVEPQVSPRPPGQMVYGLDALIHVLNLKKHKNFKIPELIPQSVTVHDLTFLVEDQDDGTVIVKTTRYDGADDYQFWFDKSGQLDRWGEPPFDLLLHRSTKDVVAKLKAQYATEFKPLAKPKGESK